MRIGILTYHNTTNYGAIFQCYALQQYINDLGYECEVIDYNNSTLKERYNLNPLKSKSIKDFIKKTIYYLPEKKNKNSFKKFSESNIRISQKKYDEKNITESNQYYDLYIAGSDQIWNFKLSGDDHNYFMTFADKKEKRNSYAASFGSSKMIDAQGIKDLLKLQNNISVREDDARATLIQFFPKIQQNIDPVFLLAKNNWMRFISKSNKQKKKYIFVYEVARTEKLREFAYYMSNKYGLEIVYLSKSGNKMKKVKRLYSVSPEDFLNYLHNSEYVITSSFNGIINYIRKELFLWCSWK